MATLRQRTVVCPAQISCDGANMLEGRAMCGRCGDALRKRQRQSAIPKLKGEAVTENDVRYRKLADL